MTDDGNRSFNWLLLNMYCDGVEYFDQGKINEAKRNIFVASINNFTPAMRFYLLNLYDGNPLLISLGKHNFNRSLLFPQMDYIERTQINLRVANSFTEIRETEKGANRNEADELCYAALYILFGVEDFGGWNHIDLLKRSIKNGFVTAIFWLGYCYEKGFGVEKSEDNAKACYLKVIEHGHPEPLWSKGYLKSDQDRELAESYYRFALLRYNSGKYKPEEILKMLSYRYNECEFHSQSLLLIARCLMDEGKTLDNAEVMELVSICAKNHNDEALFLLAQYYYKKNDDETAYNYCINSLQLGNLDAIKMFKEILKRIAK